MFLVEGWKVLFRTILALLKLQESYILSLTADDGELDSEKIYHFLLHDLHNLVGTEEDSMQPRRKTHDKRRPVVMSV